ASVPRRSVSCAPRLVPFSSFARKSMSLFKQDWKIQWRRKQNRDANRDWTNSHAHSASPVSRRNESRAVGITNRLCDGDSFQKGTEHFTRRRVRKSILPH